MSNNDVLSFLNEVLAFDSPENASQVHVTLTFAQSLDAKIAGRASEQLILSCKESMIMTHRLRSKHDAILVGIGTALNDDPQLNTRLLPPEDGGLNIPRPIILDAELRFRSDSKLLNNYKAGEGRQPTIFTSNSQLKNDTQFEERRRALEGEGARIVPIVCNDGRIDLPALLEELKRTGIHSLMVEGGASVISSFLQSGLVSSLIVTVCPTIVGNEGVTYDVKGEIPGLTFLGSQLVGRDTVTAWRAPSRIAPI